MKTSVYLTNLAKYNQGELIGKWLNLPQTPEVIENEIRDVLGGDEEYFITDYEAPFNIEEYDNLHELNEFVERISVLDEYDQQKLFHLMNVHGNSRDDALSRFDDVIYYPNMILQDVAEEFVEEELFGGVTENLKDYIDYEKLGSDLGIDGYCETKKGTFWCQ